MDWFKLFLGGGGGGWVEAALLVCLFWAALGRPERIRSLAEFRIASLLLGVSIMAPVLIQLFVIGHPARGIVGPAGMGQNVDASMYAMAIPPLLTTLAVILGIDSVVPRTRGPSARLHDHDD